MALIIHDYTKDGVVYDNAYVQIKSINIQQNEYDHYNNTDVDGKPTLVLGLVKRIEVVFAYSLYEDEAVRRKGALPFETKIGNITIFDSLSGKNILEKQSSIFSICYEAIKNSYEKYLPEEI
jgi:hypothetical protein